MYICISNRVIAGNLKTSWRPAKHRRHVASLERAHPATDALVTTVGGSLLQLGGDCLALSPPALGTGSQGLVFALVEPWPLPLPLTLLGGILGKHHYPLCTKWGPTCSCLHLLPVDTVGCRDDSIHKRPFAPQLDQIGEQVWFFLLKANKPIMKSKQGRTALKQLRKCLLVQSPNFTLLSQTNAPP